MNEQSNFGWFGIFRLGLVQTALGAVVVLTTSTLNRVMVVELALAAMLPGALVTVHQRGKGIRCGCGRRLGQKSEQVVVSATRSRRGGGGHAQLCEDVNVVVHARWFDDTRFNLMPPRMHEE